MIILQVAHSFVTEHNTGTEIYCCSLSKELSKNNEVHVFYRINDPNCEEYAIFNFKYEELHLHAINHTFNKCHSFRGFYDEPGIDALVLQLAITNKTLGFYQLIRRHLPSWFVRFLRDGYHFYKKTSVISNPISLEEIKRRQQYVAEVVSLVDLFIAPSHYIEDRYIQNGVPAKKIRYCRNGIQTAVKKIPLKREDKGVRFAFIGTLLPMKGVDLLVKAFRDLDISNVSILIYGKVLPYAGYETFGRELKKIIGKDRRVKLLGGFEHEDLDKVMAEID
ncbi:MAG: glycosyltransferase, partial [Candidatus Omnitrophica bacterium]|nr:glycosyltransferase [Candidatus Omnitrophota bacterium]